MSQALRIETKIRVIFLNSHVRYIFAYLCHMWRSHRSELFLSFQPMQGDNFEDLGGREGTDREGIPQKLSEENRRLEPVSSE